MEHYWTPGQLQQPATCVIMWECEVMSVCEFKILHNWSDWKAKTELFMTWFAGRVENATYTLDEKIGLKHTTLPVVSCARAARTHTLIRDRATCLPYSRLPLCGGGSPYREENPWLSLVLLLRSPPLPPRCAPPFLHSSRHVWWA